MTLPAGSPPARGSTHAERRPPAGPGRRRWLLGTAALALGAALAGCASPPAEPRVPPAPLPVVFVHGNGDSAALWAPTIWRWETNGWPRDRLHAVHLPDPLARDDDTVEQPGRSSAAQSAQVLAAEVERVLARTGATKVVLVGNSRGGNTIRWYVQFLGGAARVERAVLGGNPAHGVWNDPAFQPNGEFNGAGPVLRALNAPKGADGREVTPGVDWLTLRSDRNDKFAQPEGVWIGRAGWPTQVSFDGPALKGATNLVLPDRDHREVSYHPEAFAQTFAFVAGRAPATTDIAPERAPVLDGQVNTPGNRPIEGARVTVYEVDPASGARRGDALHAKTVGTDGRWGPFNAKPDAHYEFVVSTPGANGSHTHVYRSPFPRSTDLLHFRPERARDAERAGSGAVVLFTRPRGYFGLPRDRITLDGHPPPGVPQGVAGVSSARLAVAQPGRAVVGSFESGPIRERIAGRTWPAAENRVTVIELTH